MLKISKQDKDFLIDNLLDGEAILEKANSENDVNIILDVLYDVIEEKGMTKDYWYNSFGQMAQKVYDRLYAYA